MGFDTLEEIIDFAIEREKEAEKFYEDAAREESMSGAIEMLNELAEEEQVHLEKLAGLLDRRI